MRIDLPIEKLKILYNKGYTTNEIADMYYVSHVTIKNRFKEIGFKLDRLRYKRFTDYEINSICGLYRNGVSIANIAKRFNAAPFTIRKYLKLNSVYKY